MQVSVEHLRKRYSYNPETGEITRIATGKVVISRIDEGRIIYRNLHTAGKMIRQHRAAWALYYGEWPDGQIDHIDHDGENNRISNLRIVNSVQNARNQRPPLTSKSGVCGVIWVKEKSKWRAQIGVGGKQICLGYYRAVEDAAAARRSGEEKYWRA